MGIPYMTNKTKRKAARKQKQQPKTPFADVGEIVGSAVGKLIGFGNAKGIGRWLGTGVGSIFGSGDYQMVGQAPGYNVLVNGKQIPKFEATERTNIVCHREFIGDITSSIAFKNHTFPLNPSDYRTFPWLSSVAKNYQQFRFHGMIFEFRPMITDFIPSGQPGIVVFATNYNASEPPFTSKVQMENSEYAVSVKPTNALMHAIECSPQETTINRLYVDRNYADPRFTDLGVTQFATQGYSSDGVILGELWVSYCVEFFKPKLTEDVGVTMSAHVIRSTWSNSNPLGTIGVSISGDLPVSVSPTQIIWPSPPNAKWLVSINWAGATATTLTSWTLNPINSTNSVSNYQFPNGAAAQFNPDTGSTSDTMGLNFVLKSVSSVSAPDVGFSLSGISGLPTGGGLLDVTVTMLDSATV